MVSDINSASLVGDPNRDFINIAENILYIFDGVQVENFGGSSCTSVISVQMELV